MNTKTTCILAAAVASLSLPLHADYNGEVQLGYVTQKVAGDSVDIYTTGVTLYTEQLSYLGKTPFDEAAFFNRVGQLDLVFARADNSGSNFNTYGALFTARSSSSSHGLTAKWLHSDSGADLANYGAGYFQYLGTGFTVGVDVDVINQPGDDLRTYSLTSKRLFALEGDRWISLDGGLNWTDSEFDNKFGAEVTASYFFTARTSLGVMLGTDESFDDYKTSLLVTHYLRDNLAIDAGFRRDFLDVSSDPEQFHLGGRFRF